MFYLIYFKHKSHFINSKNNLQLMSCLCMFNTFIKTYIIWVMDKENRIMCHLWQSFILSRFYMCVCIHTSIKLLLSFCSTLHMANPALTLAVTCLCLSLPLCMNLSHTNTVKYRKCGQSKKNKNTNNIMILVEILNQSIHESIHLKLWS